MSPGSNFGDFRQVSRHLQALLPIRDCNLVLGRGTPCGLGSPDVNACGYLPLSFPPPLLPRLDQGNPKKLPRQDLFPRTLPFAVLTCSCPTRHQVSLSPSLHPPRRGVPGGGTPRRPCAGRGGSCQRPPRAPPLPPPLSACALSSSSRQVCDWGGGDMSEGGGGGAIRPGVLCPFVPCLFRARRGGGPPPRTPLTPQGTLPLPAGPWGVSVVAVVVGGVSSL